MSQTLYQLDGANDAHPLGLHLLTLHLLHPADTMPFGNRKLSKVATNDCVRCFDTVLESGLFGTERAAVKG